VRVADEVLPDDLQETRAVLQHVLMSASKARAALGWTTSEPVQAMHTTVRWHLEHPPANANDDFAADDRALASV
jgi:hypothetical protein